MAEIQPGRYRHYKGNEYTVLGVARHSETLEELVVYRQEYGERGLWVRPAAMFAETVAVEGRAARFMYVSLYRMHLIAIHGWLRGLFMILVGHVNQVVRPKLKLH